LHRRKAQPAHDHPLLERLNSVKFGSHDAFFRTRQRLTWIPLSRDGSR
jgi:hypothetical protein